ncbi:uncharacterized protein LOC119656086 [Hermetia illucens]|uniref:uncharacterized protein LOC119656086 n=1 Tax=Hermetia illucens TaxID=343691 RepID=UPI0018CC0A52|nr:uncharacterized protein LOC119656086 [Hermetia illucens]
MTPIWILRFFVQLVAGVIVGSDKIPTMGENLTVFSQSISIEGGTYINNFLNNSNSVPELIEYYELVEDLSTPNSPQSDLIYPDPEEVNKKIKILNSNRIIQQSAETISSKEMDSKDVDFKGRDLIDNIMYIYYGSNTTLKNSLGSSIVIGGSVLALAAQILCSILMVLRNRRLRRQNALFSIFLNFVLILLMSNLIFVVGVQATKSEFRCGMIAILLHYCHLSTAVWGLIYIYIIYDYIVNDCGINLKYNYFMAYGAPAIYVLFSCAISSTSYEIVEYCWMSVQRGMIVNFMIPVSGIIVASTILGTLCLREIANKQREVIAESIENILENAAKCHEINVGSVIETDKCCEMDDKSIDVYRKGDFYDSKFDLGVLSIVDLSLQSSADVQDFTDFKRAVKFWLFFQPTFAVCWFFGAVALENRQSCVMPIIFVVSYNVMNWYLLIRSPYICPIVQDQHQTEKFQTNELNNEEPNQPSACTDTIPLLCAPNTLQNGQKSVVVEDAMNDANISVSGISGGMVAASIASWTGDSMGDVSVNLDSISTISN